MSESLLDISKALKCQVCGKYIRDYKELHKYNTCSVNCYNHVYYLKFTKEKRKNKRIDDYKREINYLSKDNERLHKDLLNEYSIESDFTIIENTKEARDEFGHNYGSATYYISKEDIQALLNGKQLACEINGNEYSLFIVLEGE